MRHERRDGTCTWHVCRQIEGADSGTMEYVAWVGEIPADQAERPSYVRSTTPGDSLLILDEDRARSVANAMNRGLNVWPWHIARARP